MHVIAVDAWLTYLEGDLARLGSALLYLQIDGPSVLDVCVGCGYVGHSFRRVFCVVALESKILPLKEDNMHDG